jgi:hypothetical protein
LAGTTVYRTLTAPLAIAVLIPILLAWLSTDRGLARYRGLLHLWRGGDRSSGLAGRAN